MNSCTIGSAPQRAKRSDSEQSFAFIKTSLECCLQSHIHCKQHTMSLPDRVLQIDAKPNCVHLIEPESGSTGLYLALSYCWGGDQVFKLTKQSYDGLKAGVELHLLPPLFQDVISMAKRQSISYIWIDALCILQDSRGDWNFQSTKMGSYYGNAYLVLAAASASSPQDSILRERPCSASHVALKSRHMPTLCARRSGWPFRGQGGDWDGALLSRAWAYQERLLATRLFTFGETEIKFECKTCSKYESQSPEVEGLVQLGFMAADSDMEAIFQDWRQLVTAYSRLNLTYSSDKLVAFSGIAGYFAKQTAWAHHAGLWKENLLQGLLWQVSERHLPTPYSTYVAPTWSWASCSSAVKYNGMFTADWTSEQIVWDAEVVDIQTKSDSSNGMGALRGGLLRIHGWLTPCALICHNAFYADGHTHRLRSAQDHGWDTYMWPDAVLAVGSWQSCVARLRSQHNDSSYF